MRIIANNIEISDEEYKNLKNLILNSENKFLVKYKNVYQIDYSKNTDLSVRLVYRSKERVPLTQKGYWIILTAKEVNELIEKEIFV